MSAAIFDRAAALARVDGDVAFLKELADLFLQQCPDQLARIADAVARRDAAQLMSSAHTLKGSVGNFNAQQVYEQALALEMKGRAGNLDGIEEDLAGLKQVMARLTQALRELIAEPS